jgi:hypothetical protein
MQYAAGMILSRSYRPAVPRTIILALETDGKLTLFDFISNMHLITTSDFLDRQTIILSEALCDV